MILPSSCTPKKTTTEDSLFATTFSNTSTVPHALTFYTRPQPSDALITSVNTLFALGPGLDGHAAVLHGGIVATLLDEAMGVLLNVNEERDHVRDVGMGKKDGESHEWLASFTVDLKIRYLKPVSTPGAVVARAEWVRREGRKVWLRATIGQVRGEGQTDEVEEVCAVGDALFVEPRLGKL